MGIKGAFTRFQHGTDISTPKQLVFGTRSTSTRATTLSSSSRIRSPVSHPRANTLAVGGTPRDKAAEEMAKLLSNSERRPRSRAPR